MTSLLTKRCRGCDRVLSYAEFYTSTVTRDGLQGKCKACFCNRVREYRLGHIDEVRAYDRRRSQEPHRKAATQARVNHMRATVPGLNAAHCAIQRAVRKGELSRPSECEECGDEGLIEAAHLTCRSRTRR